MQIFAYFDAKKEGEMLLPELVRLECAAPKRWLKYTINRLTIYPNRQVRKKQKHAKKSQHKGKTEKTAKEHYFNSKYCAQHPFVHQNIQQLVLAEAPTKESSTTKNFQGSIL